MAELNAYAGMLGRVQQDPFLVLEKWKTLERTWDGTQL